MSLEMPFHLAIFNIDGADAVYEKFPEIDHWFLAGHSLGGAMGSSYANKHEDQLSGLILLGAYPTDEPTIPTIAIYGSEDQVLDKEKLKVVENRIEITGGNHAGFGNYGEQGLSPSFA
ncbi:alpha/beta hydrolase [Fervidibacillus halotolerans]|uniref:Alpha/beta hydrolase n=1 Tax=Fervidibacillus halotolerans TaxID=2980027 RepID=A0A9E8M1R7_9BACI|nr:alpha/beta hydrolase [Fervidibacillus halotolerans]WAA13372.1 alpha/beta hydrolase [Fervidibacillus halotolerans]